MLIQLPSSSLPNGITEKITTKSLRNRELEEIKKLFFFSLEEQGKNTFSHPLFLRSHMATILWGRIRHDSFPVRFVLPVSKNFRVEPALHQGDVADAAYLSDSA